jgi:polyhydroxyalkanoate synthase
MGGLLALALRRPAETACLALLATPWDFHAERAEQGRLLAATVEAALLGSGDAPLALDVIQGLFLALDPFLAERKFTRFAGLDPESGAARDFVALEDWLNDGVPLARQVALECARSWYGDNEPGRGEWQIAGRPVLPEEVRAPSLVVLPSRDRIVPPLSAEALAAGIPGAAVLRPPFGHIGMMASAAAPDTVWRPIADWLVARLG